MSVIVNRQRGRPDTQILLASGAQTEVAAALEGQRRQLAEAFLHIEQIPLSLRQQQLIADVVAPVGISQPHAMERVPLGRDSLRWPALIAQEEAEATLAAAGPDPAAHRKMIVEDADRNSGQ